MDSMSDTNAVKSLVKEVGKENAEKIVKKNIKKKDRYNLDNLLPDSTKHWRKESSLKQSVIFMASKSLIVVCMQYIKPNKANQIRSLRSADACTWGSRIASTATTFVAAEESAREP